MGTHWKSHWAAHEILVLIAHGQKPLSNTHVDVSSRPRGLYR